MNELSPRSKALLQLARHADAPEPGARGRVARSLGVRLAASAGVAALGTAVSKTAVGKSAAGASLTLFAAKTVALAGTGAVLTFAAVQLLTPEPPLPPLSTASAVSSGVQARARAAVSGGGLHTFDDPAQASAVQKQVQEAVPGLSLSVLDPTRSTALHDPANGAKSPQQAAAEGAADTTEDAVRVSSVQPQAAAAGVAPLSAPLRAAPDLKAEASGAFELDAVLSDGAVLPETNAAPREPSADSSVTLLAESDALREAQQALRAGEGSKALRLLVLQDQRFGAGVLQQERAAARVLALCQMGQAEQARSEALRFEQIWPRSPLLARVRGACREDNNP